MLLSFLNLKYLPKEYKDYIINKRKWALNAYINRMGIYDTLKYINKDKEVEEKVKEQPKPISNSKSMVGISSEEFRNLMRG